MLLTDGGFTPATVVTPKSVTLLGMGMENAVPSHLNPTILAKALFGSANSPNSLMGRWNRGARGLPPLSSSVTMGGGVPLGTPTPKYSLTVPQGLPSCKTSFPVIGVGAVMDVGK